MNYAEVDEIGGRTTRDRFYLTVKIFKKKMSFEHTQSRGKKSLDTAETIVLVPEQTTESDLFFNAWLPAKLTDEELKLTHGKKPYSEIVFEAGMPINGYFRGALCHSNHLIDRPHIFVMTHRAEFLLSSLEGKKIQLTTLAEGEEDHLYELKHETRSPYADIS